MTKFDEDTSVKRVIQIPRQGKRKFWTCYKCKNTFHNQPEFKLHIAICGNNENGKLQFQCPFCPVRNARKRDLINRHITKYHGERVFEVVTNPSLVTVVKKLPENPKPDDAYSLADEEEYVQALDDSIMGKINLGSRSEREASEEQAESPLQGSAMPDIDQHKGDGYCFEGQIVSAGEAGTVTKRAVVSAGEAGNQTPMTETENHLSVQQHQGQDRAQIPMDQDEPEPPVQSAEIPADQTPKGQHSQPDAMGRREASEQDSTRDQATSAKTCCPGGMVPRGPKPQPKKKDPSERCPHNIPLPALEFINREKTHPNGLKETIRDVRINCPTCTPYDLLRELGVHQYKK